MINKESIRKEFDEKFKIVGMMGENSQEDIKYFLDEKIAQILKEIVGEELDLKTVALVDKRQVERGAGWNSKRSEIIEQLKEMGYAA